MEKKKNTVITLNYKKVKLLSSLMNMKIYNRNPDQHLMYLEMKKGKDT